MCDSTGIEYCTIFYVNEPKPYHIKIGRCCITKFLAIDAKVVVIFYLFFFLHKNEMEYCNQSPTTPNKDTFDLVTIPG